MDKIYYQPNHLWKGQKAVKKLKELSGEKPKAVKQWLSRQAFWQVHLPAQALHGLAPKCELINMYELIKKSTNNYVTLLPLENGTNLNTKG